MPASADALQSFLHCPVHAGYPLTSRALSGMAVEGHCPRRWQAAVRGIFPHWHRARTGAAYPTLHGPQYLTLQLPFFYACPVRVEADLYAALGEMVGQANQFLRSRYSSAARLQAELQPMLEGLVPEKLAPGGPFFRPDTIAAYAERVFSQLRCRRSNLVLDFAVVRGLQGPALCVTEMQTSHPYFSFTRLLEAARTTGLTPPQLPAPDVGLRRLGREVLVMDALAGHPGGAFSDDLRHQCQLLGSADHGPLPLENLVLDGQRLCVRDAHGHMLDLEGRDIYLRATLQEIPEVLQRLVMAGNFEGVRALHRFLNESPERFVCLNLAEQVMLSKANLPDFARYLQGHRFQNAFLPQIGSHGGELSLPAGKYVIKPCSGNSGKGLQRVLIMPPEQLADLPAQLACHGAWLRPVEQGWAVSYGAGSSVPVEARVDFVNAGAWRVSQESVAQPMFSQARFGHGLMVAELRACQLVGSEEFFVLARKAAPEAYALDTAELLPTKINYSSMIGSLVRQQLANGRMPDQIQAYLEQTDIPERLNYGFTCVYPAG